MFCSAWIVRVMGHASMLSEQDQLESSGEEDEEEQPIVISQKRKPVKKVKPTVSGVDIKKKKKKNDGLIQESQLFEVNSSDSE